MKFADEFEHNNPTLPIARASNVKGGGLKTDNLTTLLTDFVNVVEKLEQYVTVVYVISEEAEYRYIGTDPSVAASWKKVESASTTTPTQNPDYEIINMIPFYTDGTFIGGNQAVKADASPSTPLSWKYDGNTFTITTPITKPVSVNLTLHKRMDAVVLTKTGEVNLKEGTKIPASSQNTQLVSPSIAPDEYLVGYILWSSGGSGFQEPKTRTSQLINDGDGEHPFITTAGVKYEIEHRIVQNLDDPKDSEALSTAGLKNEFKNKHKVITGSYTLSPDDNGFVIFCNGTNITITIDPATTTVKHPNGFPEAFEVYLDNLHSTIVTFVWIARSGWTYDKQADTLPTKTTCFLARVNDTQRIVMRGNYVEEQIIIPDAEP